MIAHSFGNMAALAVGWTVLLLGAAAIIAAGVWKLSLIIYRQTMDVRAIERAIGRHRDRPHHEEHLH